MYYNYNAKNDLMSITNIEFVITDNNICIANLNEQSYLSVITENDINNFKYLFNLELIEITFHSFIINKSLVNKIENYFKDLQPIETIIYNLNHEMIEHYNIDSYSIELIKNKFNDEIKEYIYENYNILIYNKDEFILFLNSLLITTNDVENKNMNRLYEYRYNQLLKRIENIEQQIAK